MGIIVRNRGDSGKVGEAHGNGGLTVGVGSACQGSRLGRCPENPCKHDSLGVGGPEAGMHTAVNSVEGFQHIATEL